MNNDEMSAGKEGEKVELLGGIIDCFLRGASRGAPLKCALPRIEFEALEAVTSRLSHRDGTGASPDCFASRSLPNAWSTRMVSTHGPGAILGFEAGLRFGAMLLSCSSHAYMLGLSTLSDSLRLLKH